MDSPIVRDLTVLAVAVIGELGVAVVRRWMPRTLRENNEFTVFTYRLPALGTAFISPDPYSGDVAVRPDAFRGVLQSFEARSAAPILR